MGQPLTKLNSVPADRGSLFAKSEHKGIDSMKSRERVLKTINFQEADRVPIDLGGLKASGIAVETYDRVSRKLGLGNDAARGRHAGHDCRRGRAGAETVQP